MGNTGEYGGKISSMGDEASLLRFSIAIKSNHHQIKLYNIYFSLTLIFSIGHANVVCSIVFLFHLTRDSIIPTVLHM